MEEFCAVPSFQRRDRSAYRRLGDVERLGGARDMLAFCDGDEDTKLFERHRLDVIRLPSSAAIRRPPRGPPESPSAGSSHRDSLCAPWSARVLTAAEDALRLVRQGCEIVDNRRAVLGVDWPLVRIPHLLDLGLPDGAR